MKIRSGFVSNSSSSSFVVCERKIITERDEILEYLKTHEKCVGFVELQSGVYFDIQDELREEIVKNIHAVEGFLSIVDGFKLLGDCFKITEDMVGCNVSVEVQDEYSCGYYEYRDRACDTYKDILWTLFGDLPHEKYEKIVDYILSEQ